VARLIRPGRIRDALHGVWLGHPLHPMLIQAPVGAWLSASILDFTGGDEQAARRLVTADLPDGKPVRGMAGEVPVVAIRSDGQVHVLADRCSHMSGPLSGGELADGCLTCPWHGSVFHIADGSVARGPATAPQPAFEVRQAGGAIQVCLPGAG